MVGKETQHQDMYSRHFNEGRGISHERRMILQIGHRPGPKVTQNVRNERQEGKQRDNAQRRIEQSPADAELGSNTE